jgi:putative nucleotidyltransferase with HDIG domain
MSQASQLSPDLARGLGAARKIIDSLARLVTQDRSSLIALTALKKYDNYTFTHMVNVAALAMAQARALNVKGTLLREFGFAALMHDIGKVNTPLEVLNKPDKLNREEFEVMKRQVRLSSGELAVVTAEHPADPFRPQVKIITNSQGESLEQPVLTNTWDRDSGGEHPHAVVEAVDPESLGFDPLTDL